ncbi:hypothetical protein TcWFU_004593 [Taenia crassiceps]|uniref:Uncharacterized protein n=1 Tax=Taenia crassiceps TaxID=6207 RepID=A0ABR4Q5F1_9CEST
MTCDSDAMGWSVNWVGTICFQLVGGNSVAGTNEKAECVQLKDPIPRAQHGDKVVCMHRVELRPDDKTAAIDASGRQEPEACRTLRRCRKLSRSHFRQAKVSSPVRTESSINEDYAERRGRPEAIGLVSFINSCTWSQALHTRLTKNAGNSQISNRLPRTREG